jgi:hypothetical protein
LGQLADKIIQAMSKTKAHEEKPTDGPGTGILSEAEIQEHDSIAATLALKHGVSKVHVVIQMVPGTWERKVCYLTEPNYHTKVSVLNKANQLGPWPAASELRESITIREASDAITYSESPESDAYKLGIDEYCMGMVSRLQNQYKKK